MSDDLTEQDEITSEGVKSLRAALAKKEKDLADLNEKLSELAKKDRTRSISDKFTEHGVDPRIAKFVPADIEPDGLEVWMTENADIFGFKIGQPSAEQVDEQQAQSRVSQLNNGGDFTDAEPDLKAVFEAKSADELDRLILQAQMGAR